MKNTNQVVIATKSPAQKHFQRVALFTGLTGAAISANAADIDVTEVVGTITSGVTTVSAIGLAVLSLVVVIKVFKWARSAM